MASAGLDDESSESSVLSVQELIKRAEATTMKVPQRYLRSLDQHQEPVKLSNDPSASIPTIDLQSLLSKQDRESFHQLEKLHATCKDWGIFQLVNHGVSSSLMEKLKHEMIEFYKLPIEEKMRYGTKAGEAEGYGAVAGSGLDVGKVLDWGDRFYFVTNPVHQRKPNLLPQLPSSFRESLESYILELQKLSMTLMGKMAEALKMDTKEIEATFEDGRQSVRMAYYPPCPEPDLVMGIGPHSDASAITILHQVNGVDGLQIKKDGFWIPATILPNALVVNLGDTLQIMSNGAYHSVEHRAAVNSVKERLSVAFFVSPRNDAKVGPAASLVTPQNPPLFRTVGMEEFVKAFFSQKLTGKSFLEGMKIR